jgi:hypothetical protein
MTNPLALQIARFLQQAGISTGEPAATLAATLEANAAQIAATLETAQLIPALIWAYNQLLGIIPGPTEGLVYGGDYGPDGPQFTPNTNGAIGIDSVTRRQWQYTNTNGWN